jgi:thiol-disulfide isomerase/thioredoxin
MRWFGAAAVALVLAAGMASAATAPRVSVARLDQLASPLPYPFDEHADADAEVAAARARARAGHRLLLIDLGANWCGDCRVLAGVMALPEVRAFVRAHYEVAEVDVGRFDRNPQIPARYGLKGRLEGIPTLLIIDPVSDRLIDSGDTAALANARAMTPQALADWLAHWAR